MTHDSRFAIDNAGMHAPTRRILLSMLGACLVAGCASNGSSSTQWVSGAPRDVTYTKVLVVGVSASEDNRCMFEQFLADELSSPNTQVVQSCDQATPVTPPTQESVARMAAATGVDAVLATRLVGDKESVQNDGSRDDRGGYYFKSEGTTDAVGPWGYYDLPVVYGQYENEPPLKLLEGQVTVSSKFYSTRNSALVCTIATTVKSTGTSDDTIATLAAAIADRLRSDDLAK
jgi:hypothetical protein